MFSMLYIEGSKAWISIRLWVIKPDIGVGVGDSKSKKACFTKKYITYFTGSYTTCFAF